MRKFPRRYQSKAELAANRERGNPRIYTKVIYFFDAKDELRDIYTCDAEHKSPGKSGQL